METKNTVYINGTLKQFEYYKSIAERTFSQLTEADLFWKYNEESNSIANLIRHMSGNMLSRFTDFLTTDGEKPWRNRDEEFENTIITREELMAKWDIGWNCLITTLKSLEQEDLAQIVYIRNEGQTVIDAFNRQLAHYSYHIGQIVFIGKMIATNKWTSLSIPLGKSKEYNEKKFNQEQSVNHFADELLKKK